MYEWELYWKLCFIALQTDRCNHFVKFVSVHPIFALIHFNHTLYTILSLCLPFFFSWLFLPHFSSISAAVSLSIRNAVPLLFSSIHYIRFLLFFFFFCTFINVYLWRHASQVIHIHLQTTLTHIYTIIISNNKTARINWVSFLAIHCKNYYISQIDGHE